MSNTITRRVYDVYLNPEVTPVVGDPFDVSGVTCHRVVVTHADQLRGELEAAKRGIPSTAGTNMTSVIVWCALVRAGGYGQKYEAFRDHDCADIKSPEAPDPAATPVEVPPTVEPSPSASGSLTPSPDSSLTGSIPI